MMEMRENSSYDKFWPQLPVNKATVDENKQQKKVWNSVCGQLMSLYY